MIKVHLTPQPNQWPQRGGVSEHLRQIHKQMLKHPAIELVKNPNEADVLHVESAFPIPLTDNKKKPVVYVCHGGFLPKPILTVIENLEFADMIVSVADWIVEKFFPIYKWKTVTIHNGVDLDEYENISKHPHPEPYILYAKEWDYYFNDFFLLAEAFPELKFVTTVWPGNTHNILKNVTYVGLQSREGILSLLKNAAALMLTGSEVCPTMLLEAWACRVPVLAKNIDGAKELMASKPAGVVGGMLYDSLSDLREGDLNRFLAHKAELGQGGRKEVENLYQWPHLFEKYISVYERVLQ